MNQLTQKKALYYQNKLIKRVLILGLGISGKSVFNYLTKNFHLTVYYYDENDQTNFTNQSTEIKDLSQLSEIDLIIASPGFDLREERFNPIKKLNCPIICDLELFSHITTKPIIAITGSNGKSTVTSLITSLLNHLNIKAKACGNIGIAVFDLLDNDYDVFIIEISSFQLDLMQSFTALIGIITNISKDHLDRYSDYQAYKQSKLQLAKRVNYIICNLDLNSIITHSNITYYDQQDLFKIDNQNITYINDPIVSINNIYLKGKHNHLNILMSLLAVEYYLKIQNITYSKTIKMAAFKKALVTFENLPSRCHVFANYNGVTWIDDSKGTNIGATKAAISGLSKEQASEKNCILILGGLSKGGDFSELQPEIDRYIKTIYLFGQDKTLIKNQIKHTNIKLYTTLDEIVLLIKQNSAKGDIILFSPACASFDQFDNYLQRGQYFRTLVERINTAKQTESL
ncbi:MAG: UDP-N-acetylmuramoyl-L-alanine--D-glutamate ligase [Gammaproteobacteria bacterium]|nr:MAG: UDP-N-acetylmuramoyl-L-alanine--D-glutamate ligase [Gammaproteobacteria bacterium]UTW43422.1 UDP-N-acetylmuramoyl-L-alanine--D-glutamate ligase [bacterium SCSIO 12844]